MAPSTGLGYHHEGPSVVRSSVWFRRLTYPALFLFPGLVSVLQVPGERGREREREREIEAESEAEKEAVCERERQRDRARQRDIKRRVYVFACRVLLQQHQP